MIDADELRKVLLVLSVSTPRMLAIFSIFPILSTNVIQGTARNAVILSFSLIIAPLLYPMIPSDFAMNMHFFGIILKELLLGIFMGFLFGLLFWAAEGIGNFISNQCGGSMAGMSDPIAGEETTPLGALFLQTYTVFFISCGGFFVLLATVFESYRLWPVFSFFPAFDKDISLFFLENTDKLFTIIILMASPVIFTIFLTEFGLGLVSRFSPQLNVFFLAMPVKSAVALFVLILYLAVLFSFFERYFLDFAKQITFLKDFIQ